MEKDAYYFPHFCNARHDRKIKRLRKELGTEGYGIFFMLLEVLREQVDFKYPLQDIDLLAEEFGTSEQKVRVVICNYQLFVVDEKELFFSPKLVLYLQPYLNMKEQRKIAGKISGASRQLKALEQKGMNGCSTDVQRMLNENEQSKVNESKVKEIIMTSEQSEYIQILKTIKNYPLDIEIDLKYQSCLEQRHPQLNIIEVLKDYAIYKLDNPLKPNDNPRSQINTACKKSIEWKKNLKVIEKPKDHYRKG